MMSDQPFYATRPNKYIDRNLFVQTLLGLNHRFSISDYHYTGFGSFSFEDFKALHTQLHISKMTSLEMDEVNFLRASFNKPYKCIDIKKEKSTSYIASLEISEDEHNIFWLDYVSPEQLGEQLSDISSLLQLVNTHDIIRVTLNANPGSLGGNEIPRAEIQKYRLGLLKQRVPNRYLPLDVSEKDVIASQYPLLLLSILKNVIYEILDDNPPYRPCFMFPLFSSIYADGQQMLTFTGIVLDNHDEEELIKEALHNFGHNNFEWDSPVHVNIPSLTVHEICEINKLLPTENGETILQEKFPFIFLPKKDNLVQNYLQYYKLYPNFHQVSF